MDTEFRYIVPVELSPPSSNAVVSRSCQAFLAVKRLKTCADFGSFGVTTGFCLFSTG